MTILELNQKVDYEVMLLEQVLVNIGTNLGAFYRHAISFHNHTYKQHELKCHDRFGDDRVKGFIQQQLMPIVFLESFKIFDMFIEYTLSNNLSPSTRVPYQFSKKIILLDSMQPYNNLTLHTNIDPAIFNAIYDLFKFYVDKRNVFIHKEWGNTSNGDVYFTNGSTTVLYSDIVAMASTAFLLIDILKSSPSELTFSAKLANLKSNLSNLQVANYQNSNVELYLLYQIKYEVEGSELNFIDLDVIKTQIMEDINFFNNSNSGRQYIPIYKIKATTDNDEWNIPSNVFPMGGIIQECELTDYKE